MKSKWMLKASVLIFPRPMRKRKLNELEYGFFWFYCLFTSTDGDDEMCCAMKFMLKNYHGDK